MDNDNKKNLEDIKEIDLVDYLAQLGHLPLKVRRDNHWYLSPLRTEKTASFRVNQKINKWFDFGTGKYGDIFDFGTLYFQCSFKEFLQRFDHADSFPLPEPKVYQKEVSQQQESKISIISEKDITSPALMSYLNLRQIPADIAKTYCRQVKWKLYDKQSFGIGFKNDSGGFELRSAFAKLSSTPKDVTTINNQTDTVCVFEGFMDFLSYVAITDKATLNKSDYLILNSIVFLKKTLPFLQQHRTIRSFFDNDEASQNCRLILNQLTSKHTDESFLYADHKDLNEWLINTWAKSKNHPNHSRSL